MDRLELISSLSSGELRRYILDESTKRSIRIPYAAEDLVGMSRQELRDVIAEHIDTDLWAELHSESVLVPGGPMFPNAEAEAELE